MLRRRMVMSAALLAGSLLLAFAAFLYFSRPLFTDISPARPRGRFAAVIVSGDMGFRTGMSPLIAARLAEAGVPVTGVNSLGFAIQSRTAAQISNMLAVVIEHVLARSGRKRVILIGQSYGADLVHQGVPKLPAALRSKLAGVVLVVPTRTIYDSISPLEFFEWRAPDADALTTARTLSWLPVICIYGARERDSICPPLNSPNVRRVRLPGDHYLNHDPDRLFAAIARSVAALPSLRQ
jgi:type IV secretory pathway VirJ component